MEMYINGKHSTLSDHLEEDLTRAVVISLFTWKRADKDDDLPGDSRYGWWGDTFADESGDEIGSKLWLLMRSKLTDDVVIKAKEYAEESLQWLIKDHIAAAVSVSCERAGTERLNISVTITKPDESQLNLRFQNVWEKV